MSNNQFKPFDAPCYYPPSGGDQPHLVTVKGVTLPYPSSPWTLLVTEYGNLSFAWFDLTEEQRDMCRHEVRRR
jgi:hypothetical protein